MQIRDELLAELSAGIHRYVAYGGADQDARHMLERCGRDGQRMGVPPERLVVAVRDVYRERPNRPESAGPLNGDPALHHLVRVVLDAYYAAGRPSRHPDG